MNECEWVTQSQQKVSVLSQHSKWQICQILLKIL